MKLMKNNKEGKEIRLKNFTSTSKDKDVAACFAKTDKSAGEVVIMNYRLQNETSQYYFSLD